MKHRYPKIDLPGDGSAQGLPNVEHLLPVPLGLFAFEGLLSQEEEEAGVNLQTVPLLQL